MIDDIFVLLMSRNNTRSLLEIKIFLVGGWNLSLRFDMVDSL